MEKSFNFIKELILFDPTALGNGLFIYKANHPFPCHVNKIIFFNPKKCRGLLSVLRRAEAIRVLDKIKKKFEILFQYI